MITKIFEKVIDSTLEKIERELKKIKKYKEENPQQYEAIKGTFWASVGASIFWIISRLTKKEDEERVSIILAFIEREKKETEDK